MKQERFLSFLKAYREQISYLIIGGITTIIGLGGYWLLISLDFGAIPANVLSWIFAVIFAYFANKHIVFHSHATSKSAVIRQGLDFLSSRIFSLTIETSLIWVGIELLQINKYLVKIPVAVLVVVLNYITGKFLVFSK